MIIPGQIGFNCPSGFREEAFWNIFLIWSNVKNASSLKPLGQLKPTFPGMIIGRSSTKFMFYMLIRNRIVMAAILDFRWKYQK
jgi:hypothetical protein